MTWTLMLLASFTAGLPNDDHDCSPKPAALREAVEKSSAVDHQEH